MQGKRATIKNVNGTKIFKLSVEWTAKWRSQNTTIHGFLNSDQTRILLPIWISYSYSSYPLLLHLHQNCTSLNFHEAMAVPQPAPTRFAPAEQSWYAERIVAARVKGVLSASLEFARGNWICAVWTLFGRVGGLTAGARAKWTFCSSFKKVQRLHNSETGVSVAVCCEPIIVSVTGVSGATERVVNLFRWWFRWQWLTIFLKRL